MGLKILYLSLNCSCSSENPFSQNFLNIETAKFCIIQLKAYLLLFFSYNNEKMNKIIANITRPEPAWTHNFTPCRLPFQVNLNP